MKPTSYPSAFLLVRADPIEKYEFSVNTDSQKQIIEYLLDTGVSYAQEIAKADETEAYEESSKGNIGRYLKRWKEEGLLKRGYLAEGGIKYYWLNIFTPSSSLYLSLNYPYRMKPTQLLTNLLVEAQVQKIKITQDKNQNYFMEELSREKIENVLSLISKEFLVILMDKKSKWEKIKNKLRVEQLHKKIRIPRMLRRGKTKLPQQYQDTLAKILLSEHLITSLKILEFLEHVKNGEDKGFLGSNLFSQGILSLEGLGLEDTLKDFDLKTVRKRLEGKYKTIEKDLEEYTPSKKSVASKQKLMQCIGLSSLSILKWYKEVAKKIESTEGKKKPDFTTRLLPPQEIRVKALYEFLEENEGKIYDEDGNMKETFIPDTSFLDKPLYKTIQERYEEIKETLRRNPEEAEKIREFISRQLPHLLHKVEEKPPPVPRIFLASILWFLKQIHCLFRPDQVKDLFSVYSRGTP